MALESPGDHEARIDVGAVLAAVWARKLRIVLVTILLLAATYAILLFVPRQFESSAGILVEPRANAYTNATNQPVAATTGLAPGVVSSQIELLKSRDTLLKVIDSENLRSVPEFNTSGGGPLDLIFRLLGRSPSAKSIDETVLNNLLDRMTVIQERDSAIISVNVRSIDPELAARIANAVARAHVARRAELEVSDTADASVWLEAEIAKLTDRVAAAEGKVAAFKVENDLFEGANNTSLLDQQLSNIATQVTTAQERQTTAESRAKLIRGLIDAGQPIDGVPDVRESVVIQQLSQAKANLQGERAQKSATLLASHPTMQALDAQLAELARQINNEAARVADALDAQASIEAETVASLRDELARLKVTAGTATTETVQLEELQREAKAQRDLLESYLLRYRDAVSRSDSGSAFPDVRVITLAAATLTPASPKTSFILLAVGLVALALQIGSITFSELLSGRALRGADYQPQPKMFAPEAFAPEERWAEPQPEAAAAGADLEPAFLAPASDGRESDERQPFEPEAVESETVEPEAVDFTEATNLPAEAVPEPAQAVEADDIEIAEDAGELADTLAEPAMDAPVEELEGELDLDNLIADVALGRVRVVMLAAVTSHRDAVLVADILVADAARKGLSICRVDAGSGRNSVEPGITDLSAEHVSYGDVVHKGGREGLDEVPWGHLPVLDRRSTKPLTLVDALTDIYEVVVVLTGRVGMASALPVFAGIDCRLVLVAGDSSDVERIEAAEADVRALGYDLVQVIAAPALHAEVA